MNIQHSSRTDAWGTPLNIIRKVQRVLGPIDLDPASDFAFNINVGADKFLDRNYDALTNPWPVSDAGVSTIYLNPPGGKTENQSNTVLFWRRLMLYRDAGHLRHAVFMAFSLEALQTTQAVHPPIAAFPLCIPRKRIAFVTPEGKRGNAPSHSNAIVYVPGTLDVTDEFVSEFRDLGLVMVQR